MGEEGEVMSQRLSFHFEGAGLRGVKRLCFFFSFFVCLLVFLRGRPHNGISDLTREEDKSSLSFHHIGAQQEACYLQARKRALT